MKIKKAETYVRVKLNQQEVVWLCNICQNANLTKVFAGYSFGDNEKASKFIFKFINALEQI